MTLTNYVLANLFLLITHVVPSAPGVRPKLMALLGRSVFMTLYSLVSIVAAVWFVWAFVTVDAFDQIYMPLPYGAQIAVFVMPLAFILMIARITTRYGEQNAPLAAQGIYRISRFPGSVGILLLALLHLGATGDMRRVIAFVTFALTAIYALVKNQWVLSRLEGDEAAQFRQETSIVPFLAILKGRQKFVFSEIGWGRLGGALLLYFVVVMGHGHLLGADPLAWID
jgi:uncharacterized membrane protein